MKSDMTCKDYRAQYYENNKDRLLRYRKSVARKNEQLYGREQEKLRVARKSRGYTQVYLSRLTGIPQTTISCLENGSLFIGTFTKRDAILATLGLVLCEGGDLRNADE